MLTAKQILAHAAAKTLDGRDMVRLSRFFHHTNWPALGITMVAGTDPSTIPEPAPLTEENVKEQLAKDVAFGFEKALNRRGLSSGMMFEVVKMWMWVLEDDLKDFSEDNYAQYGLPLFKAVAVKYGLDNPIGDDQGDEADKYSADAEWPD